MALTKTIQAVFQGSPVSSSYQPVAADVTQLLTELTDGHLDQLAVGQGTAGAPGYSFSADLDTGMWSGGANSISWANGGTETMKLSSAGRLFLGSMSSMATLGASKVNIQGTTEADSRIAVMEATADTVGPKINFIKSRGAAVDTYTIVQAGDVLGSISFHGADGSAIVDRSALIYAYVFGTPAAGDVRGGLRFNTGSGAGATTTRLDIDNTTATFSLPVKLPSYTVAGLPSAATVGAGARAYVTDANATTFAAIVAGGGSNKLPVTSDGANWRIG